MSGFGVYIIFDPNGDIYGVGIGKSKKEVLDRLVGRNEKMNMYRNEFDLVRATKLKKGIYRVYI